MTLCPSCGLLAPPDSRFCGRCGAALPLHAPVPGYAPLPSRKSNTTMLIVLVVVLVVAVPVVASAILYVMVSGLISPPTSGHPALTLTLASMSSTQASVSVTGAQPPLAPSNFRVNLAANDTFGAAVSMPTGSYMSADIHLTGYSGPFSVEWIDTGGDGLVSGGDQFVITYPTALHSGLTLQFLVLWSDGSVVTGLAWGT